MLRSTQFSESDVILNVFTKKFGKLGVYVKHARRLKSPLMSSAQIFSCSNMFITTFDGRYRLQRAELLDNNFAISSSYERVYLGYYYLQFVEKSTMDGLTNLRLYELLKEMLHILKQNDHFLLQKVIFDLKIIQIFGYKPSIRQCVVCGSTQKLGNNFCIEGGGRVCTTCREQTRIGLKLDSTSFRLMEYIFSNSIQDVLSKNIATGILEELNKMLDRYIDFHFDNMDLSTRKLLMLKEEV